MSKENSKQAKERTAEGKNSPMGREPKVRREQNGEVEPLRSAAKKQRGTDESERG